MKHQVSRLFAILLSLLTVFTVLTPVAFCDSPLFGDLIDDTLLDDALPESPVDPIKEERPDPNPGPVLESAGDGGWDEVTPVQPAWISVGEYSKTGTTGGQTTFKHRSADGKIAWTVTLFAEFYYDGDTSECINAYTVIDIKVPVNAIGTGWLKKSNSVSRTGNKGTSKTVMEYKSAFAVVSTKTANLSITCDAHGRLS